LTNPIKVFVETGKKMVFAGAVDWPGWSRSGRNETAALQTLLDYGPRYAQVLQGKGIAFQAPTDVSQLTVTERHIGNVSTDFGAPAIVLNADRKPMEPGEFERLRAGLQACWQKFDGAVEQAAGRELRKGTRGGGRGVDKIIDHVLGGDKGYLSRLAWKHRRESGTTPEQELRRTRQAILDALDIALESGLPERGPRGGVIWPPRYFIRRVAWHVLDHAWEIEDRIV
jgi:hypothetical protein